MDIKKLKEDLESLPDNFIVGVVIPSEHYDSINMHLLDFLINKKNASGSYVSISKPYSYIVDFLNNKKISTNNIFFIDCITKGIGGKLPDTKKCTFINSPAHLTDLSITLHSYFTSTKEKGRFLYIDSLSTLCIHNKFENVLKFVHYITGKMRLFGLNGILLSLHEETDKKLISEIGPFCDKIIRL